MSNHDVQVSGSQAAAAAALAAEMNELASRGQVDMNQVLSRHISQNTGNKLYKNA